MIPDIRRMSRDVARPQTLMVPDGICWSWSRTQVCGEPSPVFHVMTDSEQNRMSSVMNSSVRRLSQAGRLRGVDINLDATMPDLEGASAVAARRGSMLAAPVYAPDPATLTGAPRPASADVDVLVGALYVERDVEIPDYTTVPRGDYAIHARRTSGVWRAELVAADGRRLDLAAQNVEVLGGATEPIVAILNLAIIVPPSSPPISICLFREECE